MNHSAELTRNNIANMLAGKQVQLKKTQLAGKHTMVLHPMNHQKVVSAKTKGRGVRLALTQPEVDSTIKANLDGEGFMDVLRGIKKGAMWLKSNVIDQPFYQQNIKPVVRSAVESVVSALPIPSSVKPLAEAAVSKVGEVTGALGLPAKKNASKPKPRAKRTKTVTAGSFMIN